LRLKISLVHYLNAAPLGWFFLHGPKRHLFDTIPSSPAICADQISGGGADIGLIPSIEYQRIDGLSVIPGVAIAARNEVRSVLLVRPRDSTRIRTVALDTSSRSSIALLRLLLETHMGLRPRYIPHEPDVGAMLRQCDAALIIGDPALHCSPDEYAVMDLGAAWQGWQRTPFVFSFWACGEKISRQAGLTDLFLEAKAWGVARMEEIAASYSCRLNLPRAFLENYLRSNLDHNLGPEHKEGLSRFYRLAFEAKLTSRASPIRFVAGEPEN